MTRTERPTSDCFRRLSPEALDLIASAEAARAMPSTRSDFGQALERGIALAQRGEAAGHRLLRTTLADLAAFKHVIHEDGRFYLSLYARGLIESAQRRIEWSGLPAEDRERLERGLHLLGDLGDERAIPLLEP